MHRDARELETMRENLPTSISVGHSGMRQEYLGDTDIAVTNFLADDWGTAAIRALISFNSSSVILGSGSPIVILLLEERIVLITRFFCSTEREGHSSSNLSSMDLSTLYPSLLFFISSLLASGYAGNFFSLTLPAHSLKSKST